MAEPRFSILTPVYDTPADVLRTMLQLGPPPDASRTGSCAWSTTRSTQPHVSSRCSRRRSGGTRASGSCSGDENGGIVAASNDALAMAAGRVRRPARPRRRAPPRRAGPRRRGARARPRGRLRLHRRGQDRPPAAATPAPFFKPDWSPERMRTQMYTCHLSVLRRALVEEVGGFDPEFEGSQDWDLVLQGDRAGPRRRPRAAGPLPLADARDLRRGRRRGGQAVGLRGRQARGPGPLRADRPAGAGRARPRATRASTTSSRR